MKNLFVQNLRSPLIYTLELSAELHSRSGNIDEDALLNETKEATTESLRQEPTYSCEVSNQVVMSFMLSNMVVQCQTTHRTWSCSAKRHTMLLLLRHEWWKVLRILFAEKNQDNQLLIREQAMRIGESTLQQPKGPYRYLSGIPPRPYLRIPGK